jgi:gamma-glutamyl-gamma-aminobutyrate hydrolase PuuD
MVKTYFIPEGPWSVGTGFVSYRNLMELFEVTEVFDIRNADLLLLPGGADIGVNSERDEYEIECLIYAREVGMQVFGICRGMQLMLHTEGIPLIEHLPDETALLEHRTITGNWKGQSGWHRTNLGLLVNTRHHQGFLEAPGWEVLDRSADGVIEMVYRGKELGVQWHPEHIEMRETLALRWLEYELINRNIL